MSLIFLFYVILFLDPSSFLDSRLLSLDFWLPLCLPSFWPGVFLLSWHPDVCSSSFLTLGPIRLLISLFVLSIYLFLYQPWAHIAIFLSQQLAQTSWLHSNVWVVLVSGVLLIKNRTYNKGSIEKIINLSIHCKELEFKVLNIKN